MSNRPLNFFRRGFTLVELLVVIAIIGIMVGLLLPTLNTVRESARRSICTANQKQIMLAMSSYAEVKGQFSPSAYLGSSSTPQTKIIDFIPGSSGASTGLSSFYVRLLPYLEFRHAYEAIDHSKNIFDPVNQSWVEDSLPVLLCASYSGPRNIVSGPYAGIDPEPGITNYKVLAATSKPALDDVASIKDSQGNGGLVHPYDIVPSVSASHLTAVITETREEVLSSWADGSTIGIWGLVEEHYAVEAEDIASGADIVVHQMNNEAVGAPTPYHSSDEWGGQRNVLGPQQRTWKHRGHYHGGLLDS